MPQTLIEKIAQKFAVGISKGTEVHAGDYISIKPAYVMTHDNTGAVIPKFRSIGATSLAFKRQVVFALDHNVQDTSEKNLEKYKKIEEFARTMGNDFYPAGRGIGHQIMIEEGYAFPGNMVVASDSHSNMYGGISCLGTPIVRTDAAAIWATGRTWWQVPPIVKVELVNRPRPGVKGKDIIIALCGYFNNDEVLNHAIEFTGEGVQHLSVDERLAIANMTTEWGAMAGVFPADSELFDWLKKRVLYIEKRGLEGVQSDIDGNGRHPRMNIERFNQLLAEMPEADAEAYYAKIIRIDLSTIAPMVSGPNTVKTINSVYSLKEKEIKIDKAYLLSCVNGRQSDFEEAAEVLRGKKIAGHVQFYISAASSEIQQNCEQNGTWQILLDAGATVLPPGCGPCIGLGRGLLEAGEVGISATNRNFRGRMGSPDAFAYLASPAVVAASALSGKIDAPFKMPDVPIKAEIYSKKRTLIEQKTVKLLKGFPEKITGVVVWCHQDNLNTDGIYPGKYTYQDDFTPEQQAAVVMENYDPEFRTLVSQGDILAGGFNFGTGSSREQAATALKYKGIQLVIAGSFNETYKRNALNNGFLLIECPEFIKDLKSKFGTGKLSKRTELYAEVNFSISELSFDGKKYSIDPVGEPAQELILEGGLENWVKNRLTKN